MALSFLLGEGEERRKEGGRGEREGGRERREGRREGEERGKEGGKEGGRGEMEGGREEGREKVQCSHIKRSGAHIIHTCITSPLRGSMTRIFLSLLEVAMNAPL